MRIKDKLYRIAQKIYNFEHTKDSGCEWSNTLQQVERAYKLGRKEGGKR